MLTLDDEYGASNDKERGLKIYHELLDKIKEQVTNSKFKKINKKIIGMRKMLWWREEFRDVSTRFYYIIRVYTIEFAKELVKEKVLNEIDDIWYIKIEDLWQYLDGNITKKDIRNIIIRNRLYYSCYRNYMSDNEIGNILDNESKRISNDASERSKAKRGVPLAESIAFE
jgi:pyruvate,water dikinase